VNVGVNCARVMGKIGLYRVCCYTFYWLPFAGMWFG
jgi:hypothetical protein